MILLILRTNLLSVIYKYVKYILSVKAFSLVSGGGAPPVPHHLGLWWGTCPTARYAPASNGHE